MAYSLHQMFIAEMLAMSVVIAIGESVIANEVLKKTKGHELGLGFVSIAFGMAFFSAIVMFGHISATVNPAMLLAKALVGNMPWRTAFVLTIADFIGAYIGAFFVYGVYFAHFSVVPKRPEPPQWHDTYAKAVQEPTATRNAYISYEPGAGPRREVTFIYRNKDRLARNINDLDVPSPNSGDGHLGLRKRANSIQVATLLHQHDSVAEEKLEGGHLVASGLGPHRRPSASSDRPEATRVHWGLPYLPGGVFQVDLKPSSSSDPYNLTDPLMGDGGAVDNAMQAQQQAPVAGGGVPVATGRVAKAASVGHAPAPTAVEGHAPAKAASARHALATANGGSGGAGGAAVGRAATGSEPPQSKLARQETIFTDLQEQGIDEQIIAAYKGAVLADRNAKLSVFATRPAVFNFKANLLCETLGTFMLIWSALMLEERGKMLPSEDYLINAVPYVIPFQIGWLVVGLVMALGGPTGYAANPARDFGPRCAHWCLPIPNKGPSEWYYSWVPVVGPFIGGALGGFLFAACRTMNDYADWSGGVDGKMWGTWK